MNVEDFHILRGAVNNYHIEGVDLLQLCAIYDTPLYVYSKNYLLQQYQKYAQYHRENTKIYYAVKANSNLNILKFLGAAGAGFDIVSGGELARVIKATGAATQTIFSGVGKTQAEIEAAIAAQIACFNVESVDELRQIAAIARAQNRIATIALRINPNVNANTHPYISTGLRDNKFGIAQEDAIDLYREAAADPHLNANAIACHIGSQIITLAPFVDALQILLKIASALQQQNIALKYLDIGGGLGVCNREQTQVPTPQQLIQTLQQNLNATPYQLRVAPGRSIVANGALLLTQVIQTKTQYEKKFVIVDAAMNDYLRPALYQATTQIRNLNRDDAPQPCDVVGAVCESSDTFCKSYPLAAQRGDILALSGVGAYGMAMSSQYNSRPRAAEVLIDNGSAHLIRKRESMNSLWELEQL